MTLGDIGFIFCLLFSCFIIFLLTAPIIRMLIAAFSSEKTVSAVVDNKYIGQRVSKYAEAGTSKEYFIVFNINGKKKSFRVSEFSYDGYHVKEKGMLTFKGNTLIDFK